MQFYLVAAASSAMLAVILGAFAAHGLKSRISESMLSVFQTGVHYQFIHSIGIILLVVLYRQHAQVWYMWSAGFMLAGIVLFSGSLYALALTEIKWFGPVTPLGGLCFILGWATLIVAALKSGQ